MRNKNISAAGVFALKLGFTAFGLLAIWILAGICTPWPLWAAAASALCCWAPPSRRKATRTTPTPGSEVSGDG